MSGILFFLSRSVPRSLPLLLALSFSPLRAEVRLPRVLASHMVLQRDRPIHIWGWSDPNENVTVTLNAATRTTTGGKLGVWSVYLPPQPAGGPVRVTVSGTNQIVLEDVLIGDVWVASGQSNMEMPMGGFPPSSPIKNGVEELRQANQPTIRLLLVDRKASAMPLRDLPGQSSWTTCTPETASKFSAVAYFFGREITRAEHVPIGLIDSSWGGTPAEAWISLGGIGSDASLMPVFAARAEMMDEQADLEYTLEAEKRADAEARAKNLPLPNHPWRPDPASWDPAWLFNGMIAPLVDYPIKGVIWYQGESNAGASRAFLYEKVFDTLIRDWRARWRQDDLPFFFVQIANFNASPNDNWPLVREAQRRALLLKNTGMAVTIDVGDPDNIHPADKGSVGHRLALAAQSIAYGGHVEYAGPAYREVSSEATGLRVWFDHAPGGLVAKGGALEGFEIAGADHKFVPASARVDGATVLVSNSQVESPKYVRYAWQNAPKATLFNQADLPASPFTSEDTVPAL